MSALFSPLRLAGLELSNRLAIAPMCQYSADDGCANDWHMTHLGMLANSGAALLVIEATHVERAGRITHGCMGLYSDANEAALRRVIAHCKRIGSAKIGVQLAHAGRKASSQVPWQGGQALPPGEDPWPTLAPSALPFGKGWHVPREASLEDIGRVRQAFVDAAKRAVRAGFDLIELHFAHGYLSHEFFSPLANRRTDNYGGSLENRMRFLRETAQAVRAAVPNDMPVGARITGSDWVDGGITIEDAVALTQALKQDGLDFVDVSSGGVVAEARNPTGPGYNVSLAERIKTETGIATSTVGLISDPKQAEEIIASGKADMVAIARAVLDNPHWGWRAAQVLGAEVARPPQYERASPKFWAPARSS